MKAFPILARPTKKSGRLSGFALVATLMLMLLLGILAVGMLSLSTISLRSASQTSAMSEARSNARMALMLAIGELQKQMGPDQRISANGAILDPAAPVKHPHWTGVWNSWKAGSDPAGPDNPAGPSANQTIKDVSDQGMAPTYLANRSDYFRGWLLSLKKGEAANVRTPLDLTLDGSPNPSGADTAIRLVGKGSLGGAASSRDYVNARLLPVTEPEDPNDPANTNTKTVGRYGWWVGDESQKARIMADAYKKDSASLTGAEKIFRSQAPGSMGNSSVPGLGGMTDEQQLDGLPSLRSLDLVSVNPAPAADEPELSQRNFLNATPYSRGVLADVREGGLKRDLNTILERPISLSDIGNPFMLYKFKGDDERVPIQDLSTFYQLYRDKDFSATARGGIKFTSAQLNGRVQTDVPDYGSTAEKYLRQYTALYRNPVPVKVQFVLGVGASELSPDKKAAVNAERTSAGLPPLRADDNYKMSLGVKPVVSLWNPNNVPLVMATDASQIMQVGFPPFVIRWKKYMAAGGEFISNFVNLNYAITNESTGDGRARSLDPFIIKIQYAKSNPIVFEPGEIKTFTVDIPVANWLENDGESSFGNRALYDSKAFLPDGFYVTAKVAPPSGVDVVKTEDGSYQGYHLVFAENDKITFAVYPEDKTPSSNSAWSGLVARANEVRGAGLQFYMKDSNAAANNYRNYQFISRFGQNGNKPLEQTTNGFNADLILAGFPEGKAIPYDSELEAMPGAVGEGNIKSFTDGTSVKGFLMFTMTPGCELSNLSTGGFSDGRKIITRPFLHGSTLTAPQIADNSRAGLYDYGWEWQVEKINDTEEELQDDGNSRGFYGGGYAFGVGTTHVVQQYLPVLPPISIASLSSAHLGGYSLANNPVVGADIQGAPLPGDFRQTTATGQGGLAPHTLQAIGNSYAHPNIRSNKAFTSYIRRMNMDQPEADQEITYVDHSYLANKALWDDFFFSSITPQPIKTENPLFESNVEKQAVDVANEFLFGDPDGGETIPLPNRRILPYTANLTTSGFNTLKGQYANYTDGFADKIASHLMVTGPFNINSTSTEAWKALFSSLKGKPISYLKDQASSIDTVTPDEAAVSPGAMANGEPIQSGTLGADPDSPPDQWTSSRSLSNTEIEELANAMVAQVKKRGPFLSLSEFINRRLDGSKPELALKGALQAAIDDPSVSINAAFRTPQRSLDNEAAKPDPADSNGVKLIKDSFAFPDALNGPIAYGSTPYIDQADILRNFSAQLTPRGDTFVIRTYGDSLDAAGKVVARAWCEAVIQRTPDYLELSNDENHFAQSRLSSQTNKMFGRRFDIISFRWLNADEI